MRDSYIQAVSYGGATGLLARISAFFLRDPDADTGLGSYYIVHLIGTGGAHLVSVVCENHDIPVCDFRSRDSAPVRDTVKRILETSPVRCAIILDHTRMQKVCSRISATRCDLRYRRVIFCITNTEQSSGVACIQIPGSVINRMEMLLYHVPEQIRNQAVSLDCFLPLAHAMTDYVLFEQHIWKEVRVDGTLEEFLSTSLYQLACQVRQDTIVSVDAYPSFELDWRRLFSTRLNNILERPPVVLCPSIHRVIPIGVSCSDAIQAMQVAIPTDLQDPYAITVQSSAVDDQCGSIAITQPTCYTIINVTCVLNPQLLVEVCRELRSGHRVVVEEVHSIRKELSLMREETTRQLTINQNEMKALVTRLLHEETPVVDTTTDLVCSKQGCSHIVTKRFRSGKRLKQCSTCITRA